MSEKILIIDDEPDVLEFQKSYLTRRKYEVLTASTTNQALELIKNEPIGIVFCDVRLETDTSGLYILEEAKKIKPGLTIYLITGLPEVELEKQGLTLGAKELLRKPITNEVLEGKIKEAIG